MISSIQEMQAAFMRNVLSSYGLTSETHELFVTDSIDDSETLLQLGMDSLMSAEISQTLNKKFQLDLSLARIENLTFGYLKSISNNPK
ncbi:hypothetical protein JTB14_030512 [Gonioctena quinquepunctata]|nr:hypothetical protein JTB14_030512 [Gonioctena quinquepunctata]